jgi:hypothetical protein
MSIRSKLYAAIAVTVAGLALTAGVGIWAITHLSDRFSAVQSAADARALALQLKFDVTDFNGWQTAYGYDNGRSRPIFLRSVGRFRANLARAGSTLRRPDEQTVLRRLRAEVDEFMRIDALAWSAIQAGRTAEVKRLFLGPEIANFNSAAAAAERLASVEQRVARREDDRFHSAHRSALRLLIAAAVIAALLVALLLTTALDLARAAEGRLQREDERVRPTDG